MGESGLSSDQQAFEKHRKLERAISLQSMEMLHVLQSEGYHLAPGLMAENLTTMGIDWTGVPVGARIRFEGGVELEVTSQRKPCYQLNPMGQGLESATVGRSGVMAKVIRVGTLKPGMKFELHLSGERSA